MWLMSSLVSPWLFRDFAGETRKAIPEFLKLKIKNRLKTKLTAVPEHVYLEVGLTH